VACLAVHYLAYSRLLLVALRRPDADEQRRGAKRWLVFVLVWQALVLVAVAAYAFPMARSHPDGLAWVAPPVAAIAGTALPLQLAVGRMVRAALR
jgi:hypothetical protein